MRPSVQQPISKDKNVTARVRKYYLKNHFLTLRSKVKVPRSSIRYATNRLMVMHPHIKYHWPISKDKNVMARTRKYYLKTIIWPWGQRSNEVITVCEILTVTSHSSREPKHRDLDSHSTVRLNETRFGPKKSRPRYISAQKISTLFDALQDEREIAR